MGQCKQRESGKIFNYDFMPPCLPDQALVERSQKDEQVILAREDTADTAHSLCLCLSLSLSLSLIMEKVGPGE